MGPNLPTLGFLEGESISGEALGSLDWRSGHNARNIPWTFSRRLHWNALDVTG